MQTLNPRKTIADAIYCIGSPLSDASRQDHAFTSLAQLLSDVANHPTCRIYGKATLIDVFLALQDQFQYNLTGELMAWLIRAVQVLQDGIFTMGEQSGHITRISRCLGLIQGILLTHRSSQKLFERRHYMECLFQILSWGREKTRYAVDQFSSTPVQSSPRKDILSEPKDAAVKLLVTVMDTLLCILVDKYKNVRSLERMGGLRIIVAILKDRNIPQVARIKAIEIIYYYLLPEKASSRSRSKSQQSRPEFPDTPQKLRTRTRSVISNAFEATLDFVPQTPSKPTRKVFGSFDVNTPLPTPSFESPTKRSYAHLKEDDHILQFSKLGHSTLSTNTFPEGDGEVGAAKYRSVEEKREILRGYMPNVEALEARFQALGLDYCK